jgi:hypothetical protein
MNALLAQPLRELHEFAADLVVNGCSERQIIQSLITRGAGPGMAHAIAKQAMQDHAAQGRASAAKRICVAGVATVLSCLATVAHQELDAGTAMALLASVAATVGLLELGTGLWILVRAQ